MSCHRDDARRVESSVLARLEEFSNSTVTEDSKNAKIISYSFFDTILMLFIINVVFLVCIAQKSLRQICSVINFENNYLLSDVSLHFYFCVVVVQNTLSNSL